MVWKDILISQICSVQNGYAFKSSDFKVRSDYKVIKIKELKQGKITISSDTSEVAYNPNLEKYSLKRGDILFALTGDPVSRPNPSSWVGRVARFDCDDYSYLNQRVCKINFSAKIDSNYFYYYFLQKDIFKELAGKARGSASQANISGNDILNMHISLPDIKTQNKIANILSSLDAKIENNNKINANLEAQAAALFKSWFVDFEPFKDGEFVESELGMIPKGWKTSILSDYCRVFTGRKNVDKTDPKGKYVFFSCSPNTFYSNEYLYDGPAIIIAGNGSFTGRTTYYNGKFDLYQRTYACVAEKDSDKDIMPFLFYCMKTFFEKEKMGGTHGSSIPYIVMKDVTHQCLPFNISWAKKFSNLCKTILDKMAENIDENARLSSLRDTLLPKLMSGEIDLDNISI